MRPLDLFIVLTVASATIGCACGTSVDESPPPPPDPECGNGLLESGEVCEGMPTPVGCNPNSCLVEPGWVCMPQPPNLDEDSGGVAEPIEWMSTCEKLDTCGDGIVDPGEACDDGDMTLGDGCSMCTVDPQWTCTGEPSDCMLCGDGFLDPGEECDDGEELGMDSPGCELCKVVDGWQCFPGPAVISLCGPACGDGMWFDTSIPGVTIGTAEQCDDGNMVDGDGCRGNCTIEDNCTCDGDPPGVSTCFCGMTDSSGSDSGDSSTGGSDGGGSSSGGTDSGTSGSDSGGSSSSGTTGNN